MKSSGFSAVGAMMRWREIYPEKFRGCSTGVAYEGANELASKRRLDSE